MALFEPKKRTAQQKANRSQLAILARLLGCAYLIYTMVQLIRYTLAEEGATNVQLKIGLAVAFLIASAVIITVTIIEFARNYKAGYYKASAYESDFEPEDEFPDAGGENDAGGDDSDGEAEHPEPENSESEDEE